MTLKNVHTHFRGYPKEGQGGFTLIELSLIILLIGVVLVFALPKLDNIGDTKLRTAARRLSGTIQSLFDESVLKKKPHQLIFDITNRSYSIAASHSSPPANHPPTFFLPPLVGGGYGGGGEGEGGEGEEVVEIAKRVNLPDKIFIKDIVTLTDGRITDGSVSIRFYPDGFVEKNIIHLSDGKKDYTLVTTPLTGKVKIMEGYVEVGGE
ncbi:MAG: hypothetical protein HZA12_06790 [Nitrospirae bacterium]|nr:hypothetical protein [Nitrospirota bacterium]